MAIYGAEGPQVPIFGEVYPEFNPELNTRPLSDEAQAIRKNAIILGRQIPPIEEVRGVDDVAEVLLELEPLIRTAGLQDDFHRIYRLLSHTIAESSGEFRQLEDLDHTSPIFLYYYLEPITEYCRFHAGDKDALERILPGWQRALVDPRLAQLLPGLRFLLGMLQHIRARDLMGSVYQSGAYQSEEYHHDFTHNVGTKILEVTKQEAPNLMPGHPMLQQALVPMTGALVAVLRQSAWDGAHELAGAAPHEHEKYMESADRAALLYQEMIFRLGEVAFKSVSSTEDIKALSDSRVVERMFATGQKIIPLSGRLGRFALTTAAKAERSIMGAAANMFTSPRQTGLWTPDQGHPAA